MKSIKILLFGKNGQVGWELQRSLAPLGNVLALHSSGADFCGDFTNADGIIKTIRAIMPDVIVSAVAHTAVDKAQSEPELARLINAITPTLIADEAKKLGACLVHYSTDYVFDGSGNQAWTETDATAPLNVYGATKLEGEAGIIASGCRHFILRTSWVYGARGANFAKTMLRLAKEQAVLRVIDDQIGAPTGADLIADVTAHLVYKLSQQRDTGGLYHLTASGETSWHGYARHVIDFAREAGAEIKVSENSIHAVPSSTFLTPAQRPLNSRLDTSKLQRDFGLTLPAWQSGVTRMLTELLASHN